jgi:hypothetical protein
VHPCGRTLKRVIHDDCGCAQTCSRAGVRWKLKLDYCYGGVYNTRPCRFFHRYGVKRRRKIGNTEYRVDATRREREIVRVEVRQKRKIPLDRYRSDDEQTTTIHSRGLRPSYISSVLLSHQTSSLHVHQNIPTLLPDPENFSSIPKSGSPLLLSRELRLPIARLVALSRSTARRPSRLVAYHYRPETAVHDHMKVAGNLDRSRSFREHSAHHHR